MPRHDYYAGVARAVRTASKDPSRKVGAVVVGPEGEIRSTGYNGLPRGLNDAVSARWQRPEKYRYTEHAERNAVYQAARMGTSIAGCTMYVWADGHDIGVCSDCARAIIQTGIRAVWLYTQRIYDSASAGHRWPEADLRITREMLDEAGVGYNEVVALREDFGV